MHPEISELPNKLFYGGRLSNSPSVLTRPSIFPSVLRSSASKTPTDVLLDKILDRISNKYPNPDIDLRDSHYLFVDADMGSESSRGGNKCTSVCNQYEADLIAQ